MVNLTPRLRPRFTGVVDLLRASSLARRGRPIVLPHQFTRRDDEGKILLDGAIDLATPPPLTVRRNRALTQDDTTLSLINSFCDPIAYADAFMSLRPAEVTDIEGSRNGILRYTVDAEQ